MRIYEVAFIIIAVLMSLAYCGLGALFLLGKITAFKDMPVLSMISGIALIAYGLFRGWRVYQKIEEFRGEK
jgi:hypothetical protein